MLVLLFFSFDGLHLRGVFKAFANHQQLPTTVKMSTTVDATAFVLFLDTAEDAEDNARFCGKTSIFIAKTAHSLYISIA